MHYSPIGLKVLLLVTMLLAPALQAQVGRKLKPDQTAELRTIAVDGTESKVVFASRNVVEAPNWTPDGKWLVYNSGGQLYKIAADGSGQPELIPSGDLKTINNDHVLSPDGRTVFVSAAGHLYAVPIAGGTPRKISNDFPPERKFRYFLHGISPDGKTLAYVGLENSEKDKRGQADLYTIPVAGGLDNRLNHTEQADDGPEFSPDGKWIFFNSELNAKVPGHSQVYRMKSDGSGVEQLTHDERVNWFPHVSPDGTWIVYLSYPPGTLNHPADKSVILRRMRPDGSEQADILAFNGGQGTTNVNGWAPDSRRFAYVAYPIAAAVEK